MDAKLVRPVLNGVTKPWVVCVEFVVAREHMPTWDRLWDNFIQEDVEILPRKCFPIHALGWIRTL